MDGYFRELRNLSSTIDRDIEILDKKWASPDWIITGCGSDSQEAVPYVERFLGDIKDIQEKLIADQESRVKYLAGLEENINTVKMFYEELKQNCEDVASLFEETEYAPKFRLSVSDTATDESEMNSSIFSPEQMADDCLSPDVFYGNGDTKTDNFVPSVNLNGAKSIATPVIKSLASVTKCELGIASKIASSINRPSKT